MNIQHSQSASPHRGWNPFNRNSLDCSQILVTASATGQKERDTILRSRGITPNASTRNAYCSQKNFLKAGSGRLAGGADAAQRIANTASSLSISGFMASGLLSLMHKMKRKTMNNNHTTKTKPQNLSHVKVL
jgi:hypothetical protein